MPFADGSFDLVTVRVAPHHFSSPQKFVQEAARVLRPGGHFLIMDGTVPDDDPKTEEWLHRVEKCRDPSQGRFLSRKAGQDLAGKAGLNVVRSELQTRKQPDLNWYFETAATSQENPEKVLEAVANASEHVRAALRLGNEDGKIVWWWPMLVLLTGRESSGCGERGGGFEKLAAESTMKEIEIAPHVKRATKSPPKRSCPRNKAKSCSQR